MPANNIDPCYDRGDNEGDHESNDFSTPPTIQEKQPFLCAGAFPSAAS